MKGEQRGREERQKVIEQNACLSARACVCEGRKKYVYIKGDKKKTRGEWRQRTFTFTSELPPTRIRPGCKDAPATSREKGEKRMKEGKRKIFTTKQN